ncbi:MAG: hypothetical protein AABY00_03200 [Nanoarchaeota archaeon]
MHKKRGVVVKLDHLMLRKIFDRGSPLLRIYVSAGMLVVIGSLFSFMRIFLWIGGFLFFISMLAMTLWIRSKLS